MSSRALPGPGGHLGLGNSFSWSLGLCRVWVPRGCCVSLVLLCLCSLSGGQAEGTCGFSQLKALPHSVFSSLAAQLEVLPLISSSTTFREEDFGMGIVLYETRQCWCLQWLKVWEPVGSPCLWVLLWDGMGGRRGRVVTPQGQR